MRKKENGSDERQGVIDEESIARFVNSIMPVIESEMELMFGVNKN